MKKILFFATVPFIALTMLLQGCRSAGQQSPKSEATEVADSGGDTTDVGIVDNDFLSQEEEVKRPVRLKLPDIENQFTDARLKELHRKAAKKYADEKNFNEWEDSAEWVNLDEQLMLLNYFYAADKSCYKETDDTFQPSLYQPTEWEQVCTAMLMSCFKSRHRSLPNALPARFKVVEKEVNAILENIGFLFSIENPRCVAQEGCYVSKMLRQYQYLYLARETNAKAPKSAISALQEESRAWEELRSSLFSTYYFFTSETQFGGDPVMGGSFLTGMACEEQSYIDEFRLSSIKRFSAIIGAGDFKEPAAGKPTINKPQKLLTNLRGLLDNVEDTVYKNMTIENTKGTIAAYKKFEACRKRVEKALPKNMRAAYVKETRAYLNLLDFD